MKILIIGELYSDNLGDGIIFDNIKRLLESYLNKSKIEIDFADLSCRKGYSEEKSNVKHENINILKKMIHKSEYITYKIQDIKKKKYIKFVCNKKRYDIAIFAGGQLIMPYFTFQIYNFVKYLSKKGTKIIFNACGVSKINSLILQYKMKKALNDRNVIQITSRDDVNKIKQKYVKSCTNKVEKTYDPAIYTNETYNIKKKDNSEVIGLGIMNVASIPKKELMDFWKETIDKLNEKGYKWQMFCNGNKEDYEFACECLNTFGIEKNNEIIADRPNRPKKLVEIIAQYNSIISFRLHSHIIAYSLDIPTVAIIWDEKVKIFFKDLQLEERCFKIEEGKKAIDKLVSIINENYDNELKEKQKKVIIEKLLNKL